MAEDKQFDGLPEYLRPHLRLFLSVDIVGSTALKQHKAAGSVLDQEATATSETQASWFSPISSFFRGFEQTLLMEWEKYAAKTEKSGWGEAAKPELWKTAGDELIYTVTLGKYQHAYLAVVSWMSAVREYRKSLKRKYSSLDLKSAAWLAGFPVNNAEIILRRNFLDNPQTDYDDDSFLSNIHFLNEYYSGDPSARAVFIRDFIGPSIDAGFRVSALATPRKFVITIELAWMLARSIVLRLPSSPLPPLAFHFHGRESLKGVFEGESYPVFWIDCMAEDELLQLEDKITRNESVESSEVKKYCEQLIEKGKRDHIILPYIVSDALTEEGVSVPETHKQRLQRIAKDFEAYRVNEEEKRRNEQQDIGAQTEIADGSTSDEDVKNMSLLLNAELEKRGQKSTDSETGPDVEKENDAD